MRPSWQSGRTLPGRWRRLEVRTLDRRRPRRPRLRHVQLGTALRAPDDLFVPIVRVPALRTNETAVLSHRGLEISASLLSQNFKSDGCCNDYKVSEKHRERECGSTEVQLHRQCTQNDREKCQKRTNPLSGCERPAAPCQGSRNTERFVLPPLGHSIFLGPLERSSRGLNQRTHVETSQFNRSASECGSGSCTPERQLYMPTSRWRPPVDRRGVGGPSPRHTKSLRQWSRSGTRRLLHRRCPESSRRRKMNQRRRQLLLRLLPRHLPQRACAA